MVTSDFKSGSGNMAVSYMRNASGHNYRNSLFIVDLAMGQIPRYTERISSVTILFIAWMHSATFIFSMVIC